MTEREQLINAAVKKHYRSGGGCKRHILFPEEAKVRFPDFDGCRVKLPIAIVTIPAIIDCRETAVNINIDDGDEV